MRSSRFLAALGILAVALAAGLAFFVGRQERPVAEVEGRASRSTASAKPEVRLDAAPAEEPATTSAAQSKWDLGDGTWIRPGTLDRFSVPQ